jgi:hypothetical protein
MSSIPLDLQRRFEQRWAARFSRPRPSDAPRKYQVERQSEQLAAPGETGPSGVSADPSPRSAVVTAPAASRETSAAAGCASWPIGAGAWASPATARLAPNSRDAAQSFTGTKNPPG